MICRVLKASVKCLKREPQSHDPFMCARERERDVFLVDVVS